MNELDIPIDISTKKLLDWLISRRICNRDWPEKIQNIRTKIRSALLDMPEHPDIKQLLSTTHINYFTCLKIVNILKETEKDSKTFFGSYGSQRMKDWQAVVYDYEKDSVYLAEVAQYLIQNVVYEIPGLKKHRLKLESTQADCTKKQEAARKKVGELENLYRKQCEDIGIKGEKIKSEVISLAKDLPEVYEEISAGCSHLKEAVELYKSVVHANCDEGVEIKVLENLKFLIEHGNVTTYEWKYGEKPVSIEEPVMDFQDEEDEKSGGDQIDFGDGADGEEIDFGDNGEEIDFGDGEGIDFGDSGAEIDFGDDDVGGEGVVLELDDIDTSAIVVEDGGISGGVARDQEALSLLDNRRTRALIIDEMEELSAFLAQRLAEADNDKYDFVSAGGGSKTEDPNTLKKYAGSVDSLISKLTELKIQQLQTIRDSPSYAERLADSFKQKLRLQEQVRRSIDDLQVKIEDAEVEKAKSFQHMKDLQATVKDIKTEVEKDISKRYKGRTVTISGS